MIRWLRSRLGVAQARSANSTTSGPAGDLAPAAGGDDSVGSLARAWVDRLDGTRNTVISGPGVWLALTAVLAGADGDAREELEAATGVARADAAATVTRSLDEMRQTDGVAAAVGLWVNRSVPLLPGLFDLESGVRVAPLEDQAQLDAWVDHATGGLIRSMGVELRDDVRAVLASAIAARGRWDQPFHPGIGNWRGQHRTDGWLNRSFDPDDVAVVGAGPDTTKISRVVVRTTAGTEVHLVAGSPDASAVQCLRLALDALHGAAPVVAGAGIAAGTSVGCLTVTTEDGDNAQPRAHVGVPQFSVADRHDLLRQADLFGLVAIQDTTQGHLPHLTSEPLALSQAFQQAVMDFGAEGFEAAAVTALLMVPGSILRRQPDQHRRLVLRVHHDRPFGFLVVTPCGVPLFAGWVADLDTAEPD